jgi:protein arginine N-methyltransferase 1
MYDLFAHGRMLRDRIRGDAFARAIAATVRAGDVVVDFGCGTGVLSILAARAGARVVYAIESDDVIELARELASANGCSDRIEFFHAASRDVTLPERANVIVSDVRGVLPLFRTAIADLIDVRERFLAPGGILIPMRDTLHAALVESPAIYAEYDWQEPDGIDFAPLRRRAMSDIRKERSTVGELLSAPVDAGEIDYRTVAAPDFHASLTLEATRDGVAHGVALWFDSELTSDVRFTNAPGAPETIYGRSFLPLESPVPLRAGDAIGIDLAARLVNDDDYLWRWLTTLVAASGERRDLFRQSNFFGVAQRAL